MARKLSCIRAEDVQVPAPASEGRQTRTSQSATLDKAESPRARCRDDEDNDDGDDDDINDPTYDQDELMGSQLADAPQGTQTQVHVISDYYYRFGEGPLPIQSPYVVYVLCRVRPNARDEVKDETCKDVPVTALTLAVPISNRHIQADSVVLESPSRLTFNLKHAL